MKKILDAAASSFWIKPEEVPREADRYVSKVVPSVLGGTVSIATGNPVLGTGTQAVANIAAEANPRAFTVGCANVLLNVTPAWRIYRFIKALTR